MRRYEGVYNFLKHSRADRLCELNNIVPLVTRAYHVHSVCMPAAATATARLHYLDLICAYLTSVHNESESDIDVDQLRPEKRQREGSTEEEEGWTEVKGKKKSRHGSDNSFKEEANYDVYISSKERLPKQFGMARILKELNIGKIRQVKYLSPFKIRLQFENESAAQSLFACEKILEKGWRLQKAMELSVCYGLIKNVDLDLSDDDILQNISSSTKLLSFKRLNRRNRDEGGWCPSETLRLCFEGDHLPATVRVCDINIKVFPYIHQVSQCSQCWRLGHTRKICPAKNLICPKCGAQHENCNTTLFTCVNCRGNHISMSKICPAYKKERQLREIMAEFGCTYRKALDLYVPPESPIFFKNIRPQASFSPKCNETFPQLNNINPISSKINTNSSYRPSYAEAVQTKAIIHELKTPIKAGHRIEKPVAKTNKHERKPSNDDWTFPKSDTGSKATYASSEDGDKQNDQCPSFNELWARIKEIIFLKQHNISHKIKSILQLCIEWFMLVSNPATNFVPKAYWSTELSHAVAQRRLALSKFRRNPTPQNLEVLKNKIHSAQSLIRQAKGRDWQNFCTSVDHTTSASEMWLKMRWLKGVRSPRRHVDSQTATNLLNNLAPDYVSPINPIIYHSNRIMESDISIQELNKCIKSKDTSPGYDDISYSMIKNLPDVVFMLFIPMVQETKVIMVQLSMTINQF
ncbi:hypothetical protein HW555_009161 [Spodoptera exigua]|uniref:Uncharacterized protein n=1 Tax=Spodoptera exigua TaxID=7107 RepID=A0A835GDL6_SPOEX|nr:hypothetical protein HW555_009161 [Spodoptera exigua]